MHTVRSAITRCRSMSDARSGNGIGGFYAFVTRKTKYLKYREFSCGHLLLPHHYVAVREELRLEVRLVSLCHTYFPPSLWKVLRLEVRLVSLCHTYFPLSLWEGLRLEIRLVSLYHTCFSFSLRERLSLDVRLVCLCHTCSPYPLREWLSLDVRLASLCHMSLFRQNKSGRLSRVSTELLSVLRWS